MVMATKNRNASMAEIDCPSGSDFPPAMSDGNDNIVPEISDRTDEPSNSTGSVYNPKKPRWWKSVAGNATKGQKRAMETVLADHRLPSVPYGTFLDWSQIYPENPDIWLEVGFGQGDNLLALAHRKQNENVAFVGAEIHKSGTGKACQRMQEGKGVDQFWIDYTVFSEDSPKSDNPNEEGTDGTEKHGNPYRNLRLHPGDGVKLLPYIPSSSLTAVLITFPDPFPREKERQWRVIQKRTVSEIHRVLKDSGHFFLATDHDGFNQWAHLIFNELNEELSIFCELNPCPNRMDWLPVVSKYEQKGWDEGRSTNLTCWEKV
jgi:tRNA G46 methylase TrmB